MSYMSEAEVNARAAAEGPAEPTPSVFVMGAGVVGTALAARLVRAGIPVTGLHGRQRELSDAARAISGVVATSDEIPEILSQSDVIIISVRDERVPEVAERLVKEKRLRREQILLHTSGAYPARTILAPAVGHVRAVGTLHPLVSFADARVAVEGLREVAFGIEGDEPARATAKRIVRVAGRPGGVPRGREPGAVPRGRRHGVQLRRGAGRHGAVAADQGGGPRGPGAAGADSAAVQRRPEPGPRRASRRADGPGRAGGRRVGRAAPQDPAGPRPRDAGAVQDWSGATSCGWPKKRATWTRLRPPSSRRCSRVRAAAGTNGKPGA